MYGRSSLLESCSEGQAIAYLGSSHIRRMSPEPQWVLAIQLFDPHQETMLPTGGNPESGTLDPQLLELYRQATPTQKLAVVARLNAALIGLKAR